MLEKGETPPGIRTDIIDDPPNPAAPPPNPRLIPRPKPWERTNGGGGSFPAGGSYPAAGLRTGFMGSPPRSIACPLG
jgi:hypothetical protein